MRPIKSLKNRLGSAGPTPPAIYIYCMPDCRAAAYSRCRKKNGRIIFHESYLLANLQPESPHVISLPRSPQGFFEEEKEGPAGQREREREREKGREREGGKERERGRERERERETGACATYHLPPEDVAEHWQRTAGLCAQTLHEACICTSAKGKTVQCCPNIVFSLPLRLLRPW